MTEREWIKIGLELEEPLRKIREIAKRNQLGQVGLAVFLDGYSWATYIDSSTKGSFEVDINEEGTTSLKHDQVTFYTKS